MGDIEEECNTGLSLGLGIGCYTSCHERRQENKPMMCLDLSFTLCTKQEAPKVDRKGDNAGLKKMEEDVEEVECTDKNKFSYDEINNLRTNNGGRKKLRLTKEQSTLLEDSFKLHTTLNPVQKQSLAQQLKLKPRQVEVWFQNRRARTKLKQTETDCEFLKKCCERLGVENQRLKRELQELQNLRAGAPSQPPLCIQMSKTAAKLPFCGPYEKPVASNEGIRSASSAAFEVVLRNHKLQTNKIDGSSS